MMKGLLIFLILAIGLLTLVFRGADEKAGERASFFRKLRGWLLVLLALFLMRSWITVPRATVAAVYDPLRGGIQPYDLREGWHIVPPWVSIAYFSVRTQAYTMSGLKSEASVSQEDAILCQTAEGLSLNLECTVLFHISPGDANKLWKSVGYDYVTVIVRPNTREAARIIVAEYPIMSVYSNADAQTVGKVGIDFYPGKRQEVEDRIFERLKGKLAEKGITLERFLLRNVDYMQPEFEKAIVDKQVAQQRVVTQQYEAEVQQIRAQANVVRAEGDAEAIRLKAAALRVQPRIVQWEMVDKLPADIDVVILPDKVMPLIDTGTTVVSPRASSPPAAPSPR